MDVVEQLQLALVVPGQDRCWLEANWLAGSSVAASKRAGLMDWMVEVASYLTISDVTLHLAVSLADRVLAVLELEEGELQLLALACVGLASKVEEDFVPSPALLLPLLGGMFAMKDLARMERTVLNALNFNIRVTPAATFLHYFTQLLPKENRAVGKLARAILDLSLLAPWHGQLQPSHLATAVLTLANSLLQVPLALPLDHTGGLLYIPALLSKDLHLCNVLPPSTSLLSRLLTLLETREGMVGVEGKHGKVLARVSRATVARLGRELEGGQAFRRKG